MREQTTCASCGKLDRGAGNWVATQKGIECQDCAEGTSVSLALTADDRQATVRVSGKQGNWEMSSYLPAERFARSETLRELLDLAEGARNMIRDGRLHLLKSPGVSAL